MKQPTIIQVKVIPNAPRNQIEQFVEGVLRVRIKSAPEKGKANEDLVAFLSEKLNIPRSWIQIVSGHTARLKRVKIEGLSLAEIEEKVYRK